MTTEIHDDWEEYLSDLISIWQGGVFADYIYLAFSDYTQPNWRLNVLEDYKANRQESKRPELWATARETMFKVFPVLETEPGLEGDDIVGLYATTWAQTGVSADVVTVSCDKDFRTIPGLFYNPDRPEKGVQEISKEDALRYHAYQTLIGDSVDNYSGCPNVGPVSARALLEGQDPADFWDIIVSEFEAEGLDEEDAVVQAVVSRILQFGDYDFERQEVLLYDRFHRG